MYYFCINGVYTLTLLPPNYAIEVAHTQRRACRLMGKISEDIGREMRFT
jgi:hypothetical protein